MGKRKAARSGEGGLDFVQNLAQTLLKNGVSVEVR